MTFNQDTFVIQYVWIPGMIHRNKVSSQAKTASKSENKNKLTKH